MLELPKTRVKSLFCVNIRRAQGRTDGQIVIFEVRIEPGQAPQNKRSGQFTPANCKIPDSEARVICILSHLDDRVRAFLCPFESNRV